MSLYEVAETKVRIGSGLSEELFLKVGVHQGSLLSPLLSAIREMEAVKFLMLPLPVPHEVLCFRVRFRFLTFRIFCFQLRIELVASEFASTKI